MPPEITARDDRVAWLRLTLAPGVFEPYQRALLREFGTPDAAVGASVQAAGKVVPRHVAEGLAQGPPDCVLERAIRWLEEPGHHLVTLADAHFPQPLLQIADPPTVLYVIGRVELLNAQCLAIVGSRNATAQGMQDAQAFAQALSEAGLTIVSGLALGIDAAAHRGGLAARGSSIAVLGTGANGIYPKRNTELGARLAANGALISEFPLGTPPEKENFPRRNRLISGLARGVLVVEAALASGSLITAREATEQGREVFAIPGSIHSPTSKGCHRLIQEGAKLVESANDVLEELGMGSGAPTLSTRREFAPVLRAFLDAMGFAPVTVDQLSGSMEKPASEVSARLCELEIAGVVASVAGGRFQRLAERVIE